MKVTSYLLHVAKRIIRTPKLIALITITFFVLESITELAIRYVPEINRLKQGIKNCDHIPLIDTKSILCPFENPSELATNDTIIFTYANSGWSNHVHNWICNAKKSNINKLLVIAVNEELCDKIGEISGVKCWAPSSSPMFQLLREKAMKKSAKSKNFTDKNNSSNQAEWGSELYGLLLKYRTLIIYSLLKCGYPIILSDTDALFLKSPLVYLNDLANPNKTLKTGLNPKFEMVFQKDSTGWSRFDSWGFKGWLGNYYACAGFAYIIPTPDIIRFWEGMVAFQEKDWNDQVGINICLRYSSHNIRWITLDSDLFPNGKMIQNGYRLQENNTKNVFSPYVIHFNWIHKIEEKVKYMKLMNLWCA